MCDHPPRVVLIEDNPLVRIGQRMLLEDAGYRVSEIASSRDLEDFSLVGGAHAIIADFDVGPGMTGLEIALEIDRRAGGNLPILVLSASLGHRSLPAAKRYGIPVMFKPTPEETLLGWLAKATDQRHRPSAWPGSD